VVVKLCNEDGMCQELLRNKYLTNRTLSGCKKKPTDSHFWKGLMNVKDIMLSYGTFKMVMVPKHGFGKISGWDLSQ